MKTLYFGGPILTMSDPLYVQAVLVRVETFWPRAVWTGWRPWTPTDGWI